MTRDRKPLSPYRIFWLEFRATSGIVTLKDAITITGNRHQCPTRSAELYLPIGRQERAEEIIQRIKNRGLTKRYEVRMLNDRQFSKGVNTWTGTIRHTQIHFTTKQNNEAITL